MPIYIYVLYKYTSTLTHTHTYTYKTYLCNYPTTSAEYVCLSKIKQKTIHKTIQIIIVSLNCESKQKLT